MPTDRDLEKIEKMIDEVGDVEKKLGVVDESYFKEAEAKEEAENLNELLEDIEVGLKEEKELESKVSKVSVEGGESVEESREVESIKDKGIAESPEPEKEIFGIENVGEETETVGNKEELDIEEIAIPEIEEEEEKTPEVEETGKKLGKVKNEEVKKEKNVKGAGEKTEKAIEETEEEIEKGISEEELQEEISRLEGVEEGEGEIEGEEILDLPEDFDIDKLTLKEELPSGFFKSKKKEEKEVKEEKIEESEEEALTRELEGIIEGIGEEEIPESEGFPSESIQESVETGELKGEKLETPEEEFFGEGSAEEELPSLETLEEFGEEAGKRAEGEVEELEAGEKKEGEESILGEELPEIEEIISEIEPEERIGEELTEVVREGEKPVETGGSLEEETEQISSGIEEAKKVEVSEGEFDIELSDEDIVLITTKLKQLTPELALAIRDGILKSEIPVEKLKGLLDLLIRDAPEPEIKSYYEAVTGEKIAIERLPEVIRVKKKPGALVAVYENLAPMVRVTALGIIAAAILLSIFMLFFYKPIKANKYYKTGIVYLKSDNYSLAEQYFKKGQSIYPKINEYDRYGWMYMLAGNYDMAMQKFKEGIKIDKKFKSISLRLHLAKLYNVLERYEDADKLYSELVKRDPRNYEYIKLKGLNLIDWGKIDREKIKNAYALFNEANKEFPKESDPVIRILYINILLDKLKSVKNLYDYLNQNYPDELDSFVHTALASYFVDKNEFTQAKKLLMKLIARFPDYPHLYYAYAKYYKAIGSKKDQELMLKLTISKEESRKILFPWDTHDKNLLSNAYNDLGELYASLEIPGKSAEAISYFKKAIEKNPENRVAYFNLAQVYFYKEMDYELAERYYIQAKRMGLINKDLIYNLGVLYFYKRDFTGAVNNWINLNEMMPGNTNVSFALACAFLHMKKYEAALGELINLSETYENLIKELGEIKPWKAYHKMILLNAASVYNNMGVAYEKLYEKTKNVEYQKKSLISLYKAGEFADIIGIDRGAIQYNINYILHPNVIRADMAISDNISTNYRFIRR